MRESEIDVNSELEGLADELATGTWRTKRKSDWTPEERAAFERWSTEQLAETRKPGCDPRSVRFSVVTKEQDEPPHNPTFTITFDHASGREQ